MISFARAAGVTGIMYRPDFLGICLFVFLFPINQTEITDINNQPQALTGDKDRVFLPDCIYEQKRAAAK